MWIAIFAIILIFALIFIAIRYGESKKSEQINKANFKDANEDNEISAGPFVDDPLDAMRKHKD